MRVLNRWGASLTLAVFLVAVSFASGARLAAAAPVTLNHDFPRLANYYLKWGLTDQETIELAKWDVVIIDMEAQTFTPENLRKLKTLNPKIKILAYVTSQEIRQDAKLLEARTLRNKLANQIQDSWYLTDAAGQRVNWWPYTHLINVTRPWNDFLPQFVAENILSTGLWDGVFYDNAWGGISWFNHPLDINRDGQADSFVDQDRQWQDGMRHLLARTRELIGPDKLIVANDGVAYYQIINGSLFEHFPSRGWSSTLKDYYLVAERANPPTLGILNSNTQNTGRQDFRQVRFGLASALLGSGYFSYDFGDKDHGQLWWFDEYASFLGSPKGAPVNSAGVNLATGVWRRDFEKGAVLVNSSDQARTIDLNGEFEKLHGLQDPVVNDGLIVDSVTIAPGDGLILLRPLENVIGATFTNGSFVRVFDRIGNVKRTGFFAYVKEHRGSADIYRDDLNADGQPETLVADKGRVRFYNSSGGLLREIAPYGPSYKKGINLAVGDLDNDGFKEIVTGAGLGGGPHVRIFNRDGVLINPGFFPYPANFRGGVSVAVGDIDADGRSEIITAPGPATSGSGVGNNQVRIFNSNGVSKGSGFLPYDKNFRGGVSVAVGDYNSDGRAEIVTGQLTGGVMIKVFDAAGKLQYPAFEAFKTNKSQGVKVIALDLDGDRAIEILAASTRAFTVSSGQVSANQANIK